MENIKLSNAMFHLQGQYFAHALNSTVGNMFKKKGKAPNKYPEKPFALNDNRELSEDELQKQRELFVAKLMVMKSNFDLNHKNSEGS